MSFFNNNNNNNNHDVSSANAVPCNSWVCSSCATIQPPTVAPRCTLPHHPPYPSSLDTHNYPHPTAHVDSTSLPIPNGSHTYNYPERAFATNMQVTDSCPNPTHCSIPPPNIHNPHPGAHQTRRRTTPWLEFCRLNASSSSEPPASAHHPNHPGSHINTFAAPNNTVRRYATRRATAHRDCAEPICDSIARLGQPGFADALRAAINTVGQYATRRATSHRGCAEHICDTIARLGQPQFAAVLRAAMLEQIERQEILSAPAMPVDHPVSERIRAEFESARSRNLGVDNELPSTNQGIVHNEVTSQSDLQTLQTHDQEINTMTSPGMSSPQHPSSSDEKRAEDEPDNIPNLYQLLYHGHDDEKIWECTFAIRTPETPFYRICGSHMCTLADRVAHVNSHAVEEMWLLHQEIIHPEEIIAGRHRIPVFEYTCPDPECGYLARRGKAFKSARYGAERRHVARYHSEGGSRKTVIWRRKFGERVEGSATPEGESRDEDMEDAGEEHADDEMEELDEDDLEEYDEDWAELDEEVKTEQEDDEVD